MPRLQVVEPGSAAGEVKEIFDGPLAGKHFNIFKGMANSPAVLRLYLKMNEALAGASLSDKEKEIVQLVVGQANGCDYCLAAHTAIGKGAGLSEDQTKQARRGSVEGDAKLGALSKFAAALHEKKGFVGERRERVHAHDLGHRAVVVPGVLERAQVVVTHEALLLV
ncbi:MAG: carboxymuconolactone decarboxylase family protein, partial [Planctomycetota bacterium]